MASTAWFLSWVLSFRDPKLFRRTREAAVVQLTHFLQLCKERPAVLMGMGEDLPACPEKMRDGSCKHIHAAVRSLKNRHGEVWGDSVGFFDVCLACKKTCPAFDCWRYQVFWQIVELIDNKVLEGRSADRVGTPMLMGSERCRRLTSVWMQGDDVSVKQTDNGPELQIGAARRGGSYLRRDAVQMGAYQAHVVDLIGPASHVCIAADASGKAGKDLLSIAAYVPAKQEITWLIPQERQA